MACNCNGSSGCNCNFTNSCINKELFKILSNSANALPHFCAAAVECVDAQFFNVAAALPNGFEYYEASIVKILKDFDNYEEDQVLVLRSNNGTLEWGSASSVSIQAGTGISISGTSPYIISSTITQYTNENAQDAVGGILNVAEFTYNDTTPSISINQIDWSKIINEPAFLLTVPLNIIIAATASNDINNTNFNQTWRWNTIAAGTGLLLSSNSTAATGNTQAILEVALSGANSNINQFTTAARFSNTHTGTGSTNAAIFATASGGSSNFAGNFNNSIRIHDVDANLNNGLVLRSVGSQGFISHSGSISLGGGNLTDAMTIQQNQVVINPAQVTGTVFRVYGETGQNLINAGEHYVTINSYPSIDNTIYFSVYTTSYEFDASLSQIDPIAKWVGARGSDNGVIAVGYGISHKFILENASENYVENATITLESTNVTNGTESADLYISTINSGSLAEKLRILSAGSLRLNEYGAGNFTGTATFTLSVDASGNVIETAVGGGGGGTTVSDTFNATSDWTGPSGGYYSFAFTHNLASLAVQVTVWDTTGSPVVKVEPEITERTSNNIITIKVPDSPDSRFAGEIVVTA